ncbi:uncharacterized protein METZ01_LOCUS463617, partial [marine metagenome]
MEENKIRIGILGQGYVGTAIKIGFNDSFSNIYTFDKYHKNKSNVDSFEELVNVSDILFICLPTPMKKNGECDIKVVEQEIGKINQYSKQRKIV